MAGFPKRRALTTSTSSFKRQGKGMEYVEKMKAVVDNSMGIPLEMAQYVRDEFVDLFEKELRKQFEKKINLQKDLSEYPSEEHGEDSDEDLLQSLIFKQVKNKKTNEYTDYMDITFGEGLPYASNLNKPEGEYTLIGADHTTLLIPNRQEITIDDDNMGMVTPKYFKKISVQYPGHGVFTTPLNSTIRKKKSLVKKAVERVTGQKFKKGGPKWLKVGDLYYNETGMTKHLERGPGGRFKARGT